MFENIRSEETRQIELVTGSSQTNGDNLNNVRSEAKRYYRKKERISER
jgi:hypothetical protein